MLARPQLLLLAQEMKSMRALTMCISIRLSDVFAFDGSTITIKTDTFYWDVVTTGTTTVEAMRSWWVTLEVLVCFLGKLKTSKQHLG